MTLKSIIQVEYWTSKKHDKNLLKTNDEAAGGSFLIYFFLVEGNQVAYNSTKIMDPNFLQVQFLKHSLIN